MVDLAIKYQEEVIERFRDTWLDERYKYYHAANYHDDIQLANSTWTAHQFVSIADGKVIGFVGYQIDRSCDYIYNLQAVNFTEKVNAVFSKDLGCILRNIFEKYNFRRLEWTVVSGNQIESSYDKICKKYGGRIVGIYKNRVRLTDGQFYDEKLYELDRDAYYAGRGGKDGRKKYVNSEKILEMTESEYKSAIEEAVSRAREEDRLELQLKIDSLACAEHMCNEGGCDAEERLNRKASKDSVPSLRIDCYGRNGTRVFLNGTEISGILSLKFETDAEIDKEPALGLILHPHITAHNLKCRESFGLEKKTIQSSDLTCNSLKMEGGVKHGQGIKQACNRPVHENLGRR